VRGGSFPAGTGNPIREALSSVTPAVGPLSAQMRAGSVFRAIAGKVCPGTVLGESAA